MKRYRSWEERPCQTCGKSLKGKRGDTKYCSANCRKAASRYAERLTTSAAEIYQSILGLQEYLNSREHGHAARQELRILQMLLDHMLGVTAGDGTHRAEAPNVTPASVTDKDGRANV